MDIILWCLQIWNRWCLVVEFLTSWIRCSELLQQAPIPFRVKTVAKPWRSSSPRSCHSGWVAACLFRFTFNIVLRMGGKIDEQQLWILVKICWLEYTASLTSAIRQFPLLYLMLGKSLLLASPKVRSTYYWGCVVTLMTNCSGTVVVTPSITRTAVTHNNCDWNVTDHATYVNRLRQDLNAQIASNGHTFRVVWVGWRARTRRPPYWVFLLWWSVRVTTYGSDDYGHSVRGDRV
jgi:hypothetical protein